MNGSERMVEHPAAGDLREAARLMRERAQVCIDTTPDVDDGQWWSAADMRQALLERGGFADEADAEHIASWSPAAALAVADWLDEFIRDYLDRGHNTWMQREVKAVHAVARAYLGSAS